MSVTHNIVMIRPVDFHFNAETAVNNAFQAPMAIPDLQARASQQFDNFVTILQEHEVEVNVFNDTLNPATPDSIFPNNWLSLHEDGTAILYPMFAENRRRERRPDILQALSKKYTLNQIIDLSHFEQEEKFLEGTGSMVLDKEQKIAYMCLSPRSHLEPLRAFCKETGYLPLVFNALDADGIPIYHTNVMMCLGEAFVILCLESIRNENERSTILRTVQQSGRKVINISYPQLACFAGNMLQLKNKKDQDLLVMSEKAFQSLNSKQLKCLEKYAKLVHTPLDLIEKNGGGSARCMIAENFLPLK